ncbi:hypothetical protein CDL12_10429 [Handroanthus impetiginosus]|uniref:Uncharacterized protein n=1 Tax=Handroanthus impetiginosus TaxID=429701 RepID=A0A2G9HH90_9LAMI|nr:hypothetical protein CDL12_10429 [Handroanthus impetiginosus]
MARRLMIAVLLVLVCSLEHVKGQAPVGQCLIACGQELVSCGLDCGTRRSGGLGVLSCYQGCGARNIACIVSCVGTRVLPPKIKCG